MWLVIVEDEAGVWVGQPELVRSYRDAKEAQARKAAGSDADLVVSVYEMKHLGSRIGEQAAG